MYVFAKRWVHFVEDMKANGSDWLWYVKVSKDGHYEAVCSEKPMPEVQLHFKKEKLSRDKHGLTIETIEGFLNEQREELRDSVKEHGALFAHTKTSARYQAMLFQLEENASTDSTPKILTPERPQTLNWTPRVLHLPRIIEGHHYFGFHRFDDVINAVRKETGNDDIFAIQVTGKKLAAVYFSREDQKLATESLSSVSQDLETSLDEKSTELQTLLNVHLQQDVKNNGTTITAYSWEDLAQLLDATGETPPSTDLEF